MIDKSEQIYVLKNLEKDLFWSLHTSHCENKRLKSTDELLSTSEKYCIALTSTCFDSVLQGLPESKS